MTAKEYLNRIRFISVGLRVKEQELQQLESDLYTIQSVDTSRERIDGGIPISMADKVARIRDMQIVINKEWDRFWICERKPGNESCSWKMAVSGRY